MSKISQEEWKQLLEGWDEAQQAAKRIIRFLEDQLCDMPVLMSTAVLGISHVAMWATLYKSWDAETILGLYDRFQSVNRKALEEELKERDD